MEQMDLILPESNRSDCFVEKAAGVERKAASRYLHRLVEIGALEINRIGREKIFINNELMALLRDTT